LSARSRAARLAALAAAWASLGFSAGCTCTGFGHDVHDDYGCTNDADCPAGRACLPDPTSGELFCVVAATTDAGSDTGIDAGSDAGSDAGPDAGPDGGSDAGSDAGSCTLDCSGLDDQCNVGVCDPGSGACVAQPANGGAACDDGQFCTVGETCGAGTCGGGAPRDCDDGDDCSVDSCDDTAGACLHPDAPDGTLCAASGGCLVGGTCTAGLCNASIPAPSGTPCDDADACTSADVCDAAGSCAGAAVTCDDTNACTADSCAPASGCVFTPVPNGTTCDDALFCTVGDQCTAGACGGAARDCSASADQCSSAACDEATNACVAVPLPGGTPCDDGLFCNDGETCTGGVCGGGGPTDCSGAADQCNSASCDEGANACVPVPLAGGTPCDDGLFCNVGEACAAGSCTGGAARSCDDANQCTSDACDEAAGACANPDLPPGTGCDDGAFCTVGETCSGGACGAGAPRACADLNACTADSCDEAGDTCVNDSAVLDGMTCDDGLFCTVPDTCASGVCGGPARGCSDANACTSDSCNEGGDTCVNDPVPLNGASCDDGLFCTVPDTCASGICGGAARSCADLAFCTADTCNEAGDTCVNDPVPMNGASCDDGLFCTTGEICGAGTCGSGVARSCNDANACTADSCNELADACVNDSAPLNGAACSDGLFCTNPDTCTGGVCGGPARACADATFCNGVETCDEGLDACAAGAAPCSADAYTCTITCDEATDTCNLRSEPLCGAMQVCNPVEYGGTVSGCGTAPTALTVSCPAAGTTASASTCTMSLLAGGVGVDGEAGQIACVATPMPVTMFSDDFDDGTLDAPWTTASGTPATDAALGTSAAVALATSWEADVVRNVVGLSEVCVDFDVAQENADALERIRWDVRFDAGAFSTVFDLDFTTWEAANQIFQFNRNVCVAVPLGATTVTWRLRMNAGVMRVWVDNVVMSGVAAAYTIPPNGGPDDMSTETGWTFAGGTAPYVGTFGGSSVMNANSETFTATRAPVDASSCDVLDVDFDFGFAGAGDAGDDIRLEVSVDGGAFTTLELLDLNAGAWNVNSALLPWFGLRRVTAAVPAAQGALSVVFRFTLRSDDGADRVWVDNFSVHCANLPAPAVGTVTDTGAGGYSVTLSAPVPENVALECVWATANDGPLVASDVEAFWP